jgi:CubicO group peptidase (beta-lactamase class C family)
MKSTIFTLIFTLATFNISFAQDLSGKWKGSLKQGTDIFNFEIILKKIDTIHYKCTTNIDVGGEYGVMNAKCSFIGQKLYFKENKIITNKSSNNQWCLKTAKLSYSITKEKHRLFGKWTGDCVPGTIELSKGKTENETLLKSSSLDKKTLESNPKIDSIFSKWDNIYSPGCAIGIIKDGELIYSKGYGAANLDYGIPLSADSKFYIASTSKQFTAACIALLSIEGKLSLNDEIQKHIPELPQYKNKITIKNLIHHTSGVRDYFELFNLSGKNYMDYFSNNDVIKLLTKQNNLNFSPGDEYLYSNSGYVILAEIIKRVSKMTLREYANEKLFQPLGMKNTFFNDDYRNVTENRVISYTKESNYFKRFVQDFDGIGDGNLITTINDMYLWDQNFYHAKIGGQQFIDSILTQGILNNGDTLKYAYGLIHGKYKGLKTVSHDGGFLGFRTQFIRFPEQKFSVIIFSNFSDFNPTAKAYEITDILLGEKSVKKPNDIANSDTLQKFELNQLLGNYEIRPNVNLEITLKNDSLNVLQSSNKSSFKITNTIRNKYEIPNNTSIQFVFSELKDGFAQILTVFQNKNEIICKRKEKEKFSNLNLQDYTGLYYSSELEISYSVFIEDKKLKITFPNHDPFLLEPYKKDIFTADFGLLRFYYSNSTLKGFELDVLRAKKIKFEKK